MVVLSSILPHIGWFPGGPGPESSCLGGGGLPRNGGGRLGGPPLFLRPKSPDTKPRLAADTGAELED